MKLYFADGGQKIYRDGITYYEISKDIEADLPILGVKVNNEVVPLGNVAKDGETLDFFDVLDMDGYTIYKSGLKMIFELALKRCFPNLEIHFDHSVPRGMLGTITGEKDLNNEDISLIKHEMNKIVMADLPFKKLSVKNKDALDYFHKTKNYEKEKNIRNISDKTITLYQLGNLLNFYYTDMPYSTKVISMFDLVYLGNNRIVFLWPSERSEGKIPNYIHYSNIIDTFIDAKKWLKALKMPYVTNLNDIIGNGKIKSFIHSAEIVYDFSVAKSAQEIVKQEKKFVLIAGPSSSGKTTSCKRMSEYLEAMGYHTIRISTDDYYVNRVDTPLDENGEYDLECLEAIDIKQLNDDLTRLLNHEEICLPVFDFVSGKRVETNNKVSLDSNTVILIEGLHCLNDKLLPSIDKSLKYKIYLSPFIPLNIVEEASSIMTEPFLIFCLIAAVVSLFFIS